MDPDFAQRRRLAVAVAITVILVPAAFLLNRQTGDGNEGADNPASTLVGTIPQPGTPTTTAASGDTAAATDVMGTAPVAYLDGTAPPNDGDTPSIAIPRPGQSITGTASFRRNIHDTSICQAKGVPFASIITVTNLDNSRTIKCTASVGGAETDDDVVLSTDAFVQIADLTDAPVPVEISW